VERSDRPMRDRGDGHFILFRRSGQGKGGSDRNKGKMTHVTASDEKQMARAAHGTHFVFKRFFSCN
jgi:hypothetical protein